MQLSRAMDLTYKAVIKYKEISFRLKYNVCVTKIFEELHYVKKIPATFYSVVSDFFYYVSWILHSWTNSFIVQQETFMLSISFYY